MHFERIQPCAELSSLVNCYWVVQDDSREIVQQKIIPDGYTEVIFHFGDPYRINISGDWITQSRSLLAGQISKFFFLENTGRSDMMGIKFQPAAIAQLFSPSMSELTDRVVDIHDFLPGIWNELRKQLDQSTSISERFRLIESFLLGLKSDRNEVEQPIDRALRLIFKKNGLLSVEEIATHVGLGERSVQQLFNKYVGLSPKLFARIVRFARVFEIMKEKPPAWMDVVVEAGYYDQSHFIRNFKDFTGEDPGRYGFDESTIANFFMKKG